MELIVLRDGREDRVAVERHGEGYRVTIGDETHEVDSVATNGSVRSLLIGGRQYEVAVHAIGDGRYQISCHGNLEEVEVIDPLSYLAEQSRGREGSRGLHRVTAYMPGRVITVLVGEGDEIEAGQGLIVLEAMKMENEIQAEAAGIVRRVLVSPGQTVEGGDPLFEIE